MDQQGQQDQQDQGYKGHIMEESRDRYNPVKDGFSFNNVVPTSNPLPDVNPKDNAETLRTTYGEYISTQDPVVKGELKLKLRKLLEEGPKACPTIIEGYDKQNRQQISDWIIPNNNFQKLAKEIDLDSKIAKEHSDYRSRLEGPKSYLPSNMFNTVSKYHAGKKRRKTRRSKRTKRSKQSKKRRSTRRR